MMLYLILNLGSISIPLIYSFHPRIRFYTKFPAFLPAMVLSAIIYLIWDIYFTRISVWGFNEKYLLGWKLFGLPIEEWLFFICIPYACVFTYYTLTSLSPKLEMSKSLTRIINWILIILLAVVSISNYSKSYTFFNGMLTLIILVAVMITNPSILNRFYLTFLIMLIPFFLVNGVLTGSLIDGEVVWYNDTENLGLRLFTIPVEDIFYAFGLILLNVFFTELLSHRVK